MPKSKDDLIQASEQVLYEYKMMNWTAKELFKATPKEGYLHNAILESFAIHVRNLIEFLFSNELRYKDDILAMHFFEDNSEWSKIRPKQTLILKNALKQANKLVAHLTYSRIRFSYDERMWRFVNIVDEINDVFENYFAKNVFKEKLHPEWLNEFKQHSN